MCKIDLPSDEVNDAYSVAFSFPASKKAKNVTLACSLANRVLLFNVRVSSNDVLTTPKCELAELHTQTVNRLAFYPREFLEEANRRDILVS